MPFRNLSPMQKDADGETMTTTESMRITRKLWKLMEGTLQ